MNKIILIRKRKAQIGATLTWMVAFIVIFFVMIIYANSAGILAGKKVLKLEKNEIIPPSENSGDLIAQRALMGFVSSSIEFEEMKISVEDFISSAEKDDAIKRDKFKEIEEKFLLENFPLGNEYYRAWIRIYNAGDEVSQYDDPDYNFEEKDILGGRGGVICNPNEEGALKSEIKLKLNKKIVLCVNQGEYRKW